MNADRDVLWAPEQGIKDTGIRRLLYFCKKFLVLFHIYNNLYVLYDKNRVKTHSKKIILNYLISHSYQTLISENKQTNK